METIGEITHGKINQFSDDYVFLFYGSESDVAYNLLSEHIDLDMNDPESWTDIMLDNSEPNNRKWFAVWAGGPKTSDADCIYIEIEPNERLREDVISILPEW